MNIYKDAGPKLAGYEKGMNIYMDKVTVLGSINMDLSICSDGFPKIGETIRGYDFHTQPGGKGANQAITIGNLGGNVTFLGCLGDDSNGKSLFDTLSLHNVDISHTEIIPDQTSGIAMIFLCDSDNCIVIDSGANRFVTDEFVKKHAQAICESKVLLSQLEVPDSAVKTAFQIAKENGVTTILNPAPIIPLTKDFLALTDIIILNQTEAEFLTKQPMDDIIRARQGILSLMDMGIRHAIITLGHLGCIFSDDDGQILYTPARKVAAVDTTGAGDSFCGAFAYALANGYCMKDAIQLATIVSSISVTRRGAMGSIPTKAEVNKIIQKEGIFHELS